MDLLVKQKRVQREITHREKRTMILLIVRSRLKPNQTNTLRITYVNELHTHNRTRCGRRERKNKTLKYIHNDVQQTHAHKCTYNHTRALTEENRPRKT